MKDTIKEITRYIDTETHPFGYDFWDTVVDELYALLSMKEPLSSPPFPKDTPKERVIIKNGVVSIVDFNDEDANNRSAVWNAFSWEHHPWGHSFWFLVARELDFYIYLDKLKLKEKGVFT